MRARQGRKHVHEEGRMLLGYGHSEGKRLHIERHASYARQMDTGSL